MKNIHILLILLFAFLATSCSKTVKVEHEGETKSGMLEEVPKWFVDKEAGQGFLGKKDKFYLYGIGVATSPDLQLAMDKATMIAKADLADVMHGEMNKKAETFIKEIGQSTSKDVVTETQSTIVNVIKNTKVQGYEQWKIEISITPNSEYRVYLGLMLPLGEFNKLADLIEQEAQAKINSRLNDIETNADEAFEELSAVPVEKVTELM